ncbi:unnamed protein product, partial [Brachionus calyciflorus]
MSLKEILEKFINFYNNQQLDELMEIYSDDAVNHQTALQPIEGKDAIRNMLKEQFSRVKAYCNIQKMVEDENCVALEWTDPTGFKGCTFFYFKD